MDMESFSLNINKGIKLIRIENPKIQKKINFFFIVVPFLVVLYFVFCKYRKKKVLQHYYIIIWGHLSIEFCRFFYH